MDASAVVVAGVFGTIVRVLLIVIGVVLVIVIGYVIYGALPGTAARRNAKYKAQRDHGKSPACAAEAHSQCPGCECSCHPKPKMTLECASLGRHERCSGSLPNTHEACECSCHRSSAPLPPPAP